MKYGRPPEEVALLAERLRGTRRHGQSIISWVEHRAQGLQEMVRAGWTWEQLAEALNAAGIAYTAGTRMGGGGVSRGAWTGGQLRRTSRRALLRAAARGAAMQTLLQPPATPTPDQIKPEPKLELAVGKMRVFGLDPPQAQPDPEPSEMQKHLDEKEARTKAVFDRFFKEKEGNG